MPIICLEGASGVGKSTTARELAKRYNTYTVPEVNFLFKRPDPMPAHWYFERQVERWQIAQEKVANHELVILDGDLFQPLWYNWSYNFEIFGQTLEGLRDFYRPHIQNHTIAFPDRYFLLYIHESELGQRKENDQTRSRGNFEKHLEMIEPQKRYFKAMSEHAPQLVTFIEATTIQANMEVILEQASSAASKPLEQSSSLQLFDSMIDWLASNKNPL